MTREEVRHTAAIAVTAGVMLAIPFSCVLLKAALRLKGETPEVAAEGESGGPSARALC
jgi:hypothetical protein